MKKLTSKQWASLKRSRSDALKKQTEGFESQEIFKLSIEAKLTELGVNDQWFTNFQRCGRETFFSMCVNCQSVKEMSYQCSQKFCPRCNWRIAAKRRDLLQKLTAGISGCKHVVLTQRNFEHLTREKIQESRKNLLRLRKQKIFGRVSGGCASLEFTNESRGWHMHWHLLLQSSFISSSELAVKWGQLVGQEFAIVKVLDVSEKSYLQEICKYAAKGSEIARWNGNQILEFVTAMRGTRMFTVFGKFIEMRKFAQAILNCEKVESVCDCGCGLKIFGETEQSCERQFWKQFER